MLQIAEVVLRAEDWFGLLGLADELVLAVHALNRKPFVEETFTIGTYGKVGETKGSYDLIEALASLAAIGAKFNFLTMASGTRSELDRYYGTILRNQCLTERSWILPPLAPWRIPSFLRRCQAVCFLERDFLIQFHGPLIPREVLSSGTCLVCSREVAEKREDGHALVDRRNAVIILSRFHGTVMCSRLDSWSSSRTPICRGHSEDRGNCCPNSGKNKLSCLETLAQHLIEQIRAGSSAARAESPGDKT